MLQVPEQYAGQQMRCPLCNSTFTVPPLPDAPSLAPPPAPAPGAAEVYPLADDHNPLAPPPPSSAPPLSAPARAPAPPPVVGDYTKLRSIVISPRVVPWIAPIALLVLFVLTFFPWVSGGYGGSLNAWNLGFSTGGSALFV